MSARVEARAGQPPFGLPKGGGAGTNPAMEAASSPLIAPIPTGPALREYPVPSTALRVLPDAGCDRFTRVAATMFRVPWALLATVEPDGFVVRSLAGPAGVEVPWDEELAVAPMACGPGEIAWTEDASTDPRFARHAAVTGAFSLRFYAAVPIRSVSGQMLGLLGVFDARTRQMSVDEQQALHDLALSAAEFLRFRFRSQSDEESGAPRSFGQRFIEALVHHSSDVFTVLSADGKISFASGAHAKTIGFQPEQMVGENVFSYVHEDDRERVATAFKRIVDNPAVTETVEFRFRHADGHWVELESTGQNSLGDPDVQGIMVRSRDASERKRYLNKLRDSESRYRQLFEVNPQPMWAFEWENHTMLAVNDAALRHYGYSREEFMALRVEDLWTADDVPAFRAHISRREKLPVRTVWRHRKRSGDIIVVEVSTSTVDFFGSKAHLVAVQDITERANAVESLRLRNRYMAAQVEMQLELLKPRPLEECVQALLAALGKAIGASRAYYYVNGSDARSGRLYAAPSQEWCAPGIFAEMEVFPQERISYDAYDPTWLKALKSGQKLALVIEQLAEPERSLFSAGGVRSALLAPVLVRGGFIGFLGLDDCVATRVWDRSEADLLQAAAAALALALEAEAVSQSLDEEKDRFAVTLASIADGVITTDAGGRVIFANRVAENLLGRSQQELAGCELSGFFQMGSSNSNRSDALWRVLESGEVVIQPSGAFAAHKNGMRIPVAKSTAPIRNRAGKIIGAVRVFRDITQDQRMAAEMAKASKLESVGLLAGGIAHDFNNILTAVVGNISLAKMFLHDPARAAAKLDEAERASFRARDLTTQLLTFSKGGAPIKKLARLQDIIRESIGFALHGSKVVCRFSLPDTLPPVEADAGQLSQVINNLAINAVQAMPNGGTLDVWAQERDLEDGHPTGLPPGPYVKICVEDSGAGIPPEDQVKIFDPFFTTKDHGSGLGLATSYSIIKNHGGLINFDSIVDVGSIFRVYLPVSDRPLDRTEVVVGTFVAGGEAQRGDGRVLVMDDEADIRQLASGMLEQLGYEVSAVPDGQMAIERFQRARDQGTPYDVVILDLTVPGGLGGLEVIERLRALAPHVRAIVSSGYANAPIMADYSRHGFADILSKPYRIEEIAAVVHRVLNGDANISPEIVPEAV